MCILVITIPVKSNDGILDTPFVQEYHESYFIDNQNGGNDVRAIAVDRDGCTWAATGVGVYLLEQGNKQWTGLMAKNDAGPCFAITIDNTGTVWIGAWNGIYRATTTGLKKIDGIDHPVSALAATATGIIAMGPDGIWHCQHDIWQRQYLPYSRAVRAILPGTNGDLWLATGMGLYHQTADAGFTLYQTEKQLISANIYDVAFAAPDSLWIGGLGGITVYKNGRRVNNFTPADGLPTVFVQCVSRAPNGTMWVGTTLGVARFNGENMSLRHCNRWLTNDNVRDIAFDADGTAWIATANGVSAIKQKTMTLADKAAYFHRICLARHVREPGLVEKCRLTVPGDTSNWQPRDDDNDGQYTSMYLAMESYRYAVTKSEAAKANAKKAFDALRFLQVVTGTPGFVARTVIPASWTTMADPNRTYMEPEWADMRVGNPREKRVEQRWRQSQDGKWLWKGDTSSDEITGHMYGYLFYYDLVADTAEKKRVREHVCRIVDYIIDSGFVLKDIDNAHTKWAVWSPEKLNQDPDWATERGVNSVEILSFLKLAHHMSGKKRYHDEYLRLLHDHGYAENVRQAKTLNPSWRTHIDDELLALAYPCLLLHETDPELRQLYRKSIDQWFAAAKADQSPFFTFVYNACTGQSLQLKSTCTYLRDVSLDLIRWRMDNSKREDIHLVRFPEMEELQTSRLLSPDEICLTRWDNNPWTVIQGDGGHTESDGVFWLLPYWMGRYYGFINSN